MLETTSMKAHWSQKLLSQFKIRFLNSTAFTLMKSRSVFQWLSKNKPSLCKPAPPLLLFQSEFSPFPFLGGGKNPRDLSREATKEEIFSLPVLYQH